MQDFSFNFQVPFMQPSGTYDGFNQMMVMPEEQLERMYPQIYFIVNPIVIRQCDMFDNTYGASYIPTREELERMTDDILLDVESRVSPQMTERYSNPSGNPNWNPYGNPNWDPPGNPDGNRFLRALIGTLLIRELVDRRRHRPFRRFPGFFPGFFPGIF